MPDRQPSKSARKKQPAVEPDPSHPTAASPPAEDQAANDLEWNLLEAAFNQLEQGILVADNQGRIVLFNRVAAAILGYQARQVIGRLTLWNLCPACQPALTRPQDAASGAVEPTGRYSMPVNRPGAAPVNVEIAPVYQADRLAGFTGLIEPPSARKEVAGPARRAGISRILAVVAHEINNPLQALRSSLELGLDPRKSPERRREYLLAADHEIGRITRVITQMRDFYRLQPATSARTDIVAVLSHSLALVKTQTVVQAEQIALEPDPAIPLVNFPAHGLQTIFMNMITHALEHLPANAALRISVQKGFGGLVRIMLQSNSEPLKSGPILNQALSLSYELVAELGGSLRLETTAGYSLSLSLPY